MWRTDGKTDLDIMDFHQSKRMVVLTTTEKKTMHLSKPHVHITKIRVKVPADTAHAYLQLSIVYLQHCQNHFMHNT